RVLFCQRQKHNHFISTAADKLRCHHHRVKGIYTLIRFNLGDTTVNRFKVEGVIHNSCRDVDREGGAVAADQWLADNNGDTFMVLVVLKSLRGYSCREGISHARNDPLYHR